MFAEAASAAPGSEAPQSADSEFKFSSTAVQVLTGLTLLLHSDTGSFQHESILNYLRPKCHPSQVRASESTLHRRFACMGCTARSGGRSEPTFFNDYKSAAVHYARSSQCNKSMRGIKVVTVQLNTRPQHHIGDGVAGAGGAPGAWRPQSAPARRAGTMT